MPAPEVTQPKAQTMDVPSAKEIQEQPVCDTALIPFTIFSIQKLIATQKPVEKMTVEEPVSMRGGGAGGLCCGL